MELDIYANCTLIKLTSKEKYKPEGGCGFNFELPFLGVIFQLKFMKFITLTRDRHLPFSKGSHYNPSHLCEWAPCRLFVSVKRCPNQKDCNGQGKPSSWDPIAQTPAHIVLNVH